MADQNAPLSPQLSNRPSAGGPGAAGNGGNGGNGGRRGGFAMPKFGNPFAGLGSKLPKDWWIWAAGAFLLALGYGYWQYAGPVSFMPDNRVIQLRGVPGLSLKITFAHLALAVMCLWGLLEAQDREDPFWLDWWVPYAFAAVFVYGQLNWAKIMATSQSAMWWGGFAGGAIILLAVAILWNPSEEEAESWVDRMDTTALFNAMMVLIVLHYAKFPTLPYPAMLPFPAVVVVAVLALIKEMGRTPKFGFLVILLGVVAAIMNTVAVVAVTLAVAVILANLATHQGWIPGSHRRPQTTTPNIPGINKGLKLIKSWDVCIAWWAVYVVANFLIYQKDGVYNYVLMVIGGR